MDRFYAANSFAKREKWSDNLGLGQDTPCKRYAESRRDYITISAGMTASLQTLDVTINKLVKGHLHMEINDYYNIENRIVRNQRESFVKLSLQEIVIWVTNS